MIYVNPADILVRYNVKIEKDVLPEEVAKELYPVENELKAIALSVFNGDEDEVIETINDAISMNYDPLELIDNALMIGMEIVSKLYEDGILFLPDVMLSAHAMTNGIDYCRQKAKDIHEFKGKVVSFVVEGDMHDIGKKIVTVFLRAHGYEVIDLGNDVFAHEVISAVKKEKPIMISGTALMTTTMYAFKDIDNMLIENGINIPFICGGGAVKQDFVDEECKLGVYCEDAAQAPKIADSILNGDSITLLRKKFHKH